MMSFISFSLLLKAPEVQTQSTVSAASDMFSLGLVVAAIFNRGRPLIQANHSNPNYTKQMEMVSRDGARHHHITRLPVLVWTVSPNQLANTDPNESVKAGRVYFDLATSIPPLFHPVVVASVAHTSIKSSSNQPARHVYFLFIVHLSAAVPRFLFLPHFVVVVKKMKIDNRPNQIFLFILS